MTAPKTLGQHFGVNLEISDDIAQHKLGTRVDLVNGGSAIYCLANTAVTGEGYVVLIDDVWGVDHITTTNANNLKGQPVGVAQCAISAGDYGWIVVRGQTQMRVAASCAANVALATTATAGVLDDATTTALTEIVGAFCLDTNGGSVGNVLGMLYDARCGIELP